VPAGFAGPLPLGVSFMAGKNADAHLLGVGFRLRAGQQCAAGADVPAHHAESLIW